MKAKIIDQIAKLESALKRAEDFASQMDISDEEWRVRCYFKSPDLNQKVMYSISSFDGFSPSYIYKIHAPFIGAIIERMELLDDTTSSVVESIPLNCVWNR